MSAIVGISFLDGQPVPRQVLRRMLATLAHRGPDGEGLWSAGAIGLGHRLLWTTPESLQETLPRVNVRGDLVISADARLDNRDALLTSLDLPRYPNQEIPDSQLILAAYERWGERCPEHLLGDFALAIWDHRAQTLFCARDHFGVKPFYYFYRPDRVFAFASEIKALLGCPDLSCRLDELRVADYLSRNFEDKAITFHQEILRLPPGHRLTVGVKGMRLSPYWEPDLSVEVRLRSDAEYAEAFREIFAEAVRCRLRSAFPVGSMLSGGLDSSSIACTMRQLLGGDASPRPHTFSAIFPSLPAADLRKIDERRYVSSVVALGGVCPHYVLADRLSPFTDLERVFRHMDEAIFAPNLYMHWALYKAAQQQSVRVLLDGIDGDSTVSHGFEYLTELARLGKWRTLYSEASALSKRSKAFRPPRRVVWQLGFSPLVPEYARGLWRILRGHPAPRGVAHSVIKPDFARRIGLTERTHALLKHAAGPARTSREQHWGGLRSGLFPYALELADKAAAAFAVEPRYPFFDRRLVEFCLAIPASQKLHQGWTRIVMRRAMTGILPPEVQWRFDKANLFPNFKRRLWDSERTTLEEVIVKDPQTIAPYVDLPRLRGVYQRYAARPTQADDEALTVYGAVVLALWLRRSGMAM
jgi:asparagine synthase (glutamine-hydrolysing)